jgi:hypothetical protein
LRANRAAIFTLSLCFRQSSSRTTEKPNKKKISHHIAEGPFFAETLKQEEKA